MTLRFLAGTTFFLVVCSFTFVELMPRVERQNEPGRSGWRKVVNTDNWRNKKYVLWAVLVPTALFGYFVPYVHIVRTIAAAVLNLHMMQSINILISSRSST